MFDAVERFDEEAHARGISSSTAGREITHRDAA